MPPFGSHSAHGSIARASAIIPPSNSSVRRQGLPTLRVLAGDQVNHSSANVFGLDTLWSAGNQSRNPHARQQRPSDIAEEYIGGARVAISPEHKTVSAAFSSDESRVRKEWVSPCRERRWP